MIPYNTKMVSVCELEKLKLVRRECLSIMFDPDSTQKQTNEALQVFEFVDMEIEFWLAMNTNL